MLFYQDLSSIQDITNSNDTVDVLIDSSIKNKESLIQRISDCLRIPYPNENWNGLIDDFSDLSWLPQTIIRIIHIDLPSLPEKDLKDYLFVLYHAQGVWSGLNEKILQLYFNEKDKDLVINLKPQRIDTLICFSKEEEKALISLLSDTPALLQPILNGPRWKIGVSTHITIDMDIALEIRNYLNHLISNPATNDTHSYSTIKDLINCIRI